MQRSCVAQPAAIYRAANRRQAKRAFRGRFAGRAIGREQWLMVERDLERLLNFCFMPEGHWKKVRSTNVIERAFREVRRSTRPMSSFAHRASCERIVFRCITYLNSSSDRNPLKDLTQNARR